MTRYPSKAAAAKDLLGRKDLERWSICHRMYTAKVIDQPDKERQESAVEQPLKDGLSQRFRS